MSQFTDFTKYFAQRRRPKMIKFSGYGYHGGSFIATLENNTTFRNAKRSENNGGWPAWCTLPEIPIVGIYYDDHWHEGTLNVNGYIISASRNDALKMLQELSKNIEEHRLYDVC